jgi:hypothetical protein
MAPRNRQAVPPQAEPPAPRGIGNPPDNAPAQRSRTRVQATTATLEDGEEFDLENVSDSEDDYEPMRSNHGHGTNPTAQGEDINDPDTTPLPKTAAADIRYFFDKSGDKVICNLCRQVFAHALQFFNLTK